MPEAAPMPLATTDATEPLPLPPFAVNAAVARRSDAIAPRNFNDLLRTAEIVAKSKAYPNIRDAAQAFVVMMAGLELDLPLSSALANIHLVEGKPVLGAHAIGNLIKRSRRYDYEIRRLSAEQGCEIEFFRLEWFATGSTEPRRHPVGTAGFTLGEARTAGLMTRKNWQNYPLDMLYARALARGARRFCPDVFFGVVYAPGELPEGDDEPQLVAARVVESVAPEPAPAACGGILSSTEYYQLHHVSPDDEPVEPACLRDLHARLVAGLGGEAPARAAWQAAGVVLRRGETITVRQVIRLEDSLRSRAAAGTKE